MTRQLKASLLKNLKTKLSSKFGMSFVSNLSMKDSEMEPRTGSPMLIDRFSNLLPYAHFSEEDNLCAIAAPNFNSFEGLGYVIEIVPQTGCTPVMAKSLKHLFGQGIPEGTGIQFCLFASPYVKPLTDLILSSAVEPSSKDDPLRVEQLELMKGLSKARADFLLKGSYQDPKPGITGRLCNFRSWMSVVIPTSDPFNLAVRDKVKKIREGHMALLRQWHLSPWSWNESVLINTLSQLLNPHLFLENAWTPTVHDPDREPRTQCVLADTRINIEPNFIDFHSLYRQKRVAAVSMSVRNYPEAFSLDNVNKLTGSPQGDKAPYPCPYLITTCLSTKSYESAKAQTQLKSARAEQIASTEIVKFMPVMRKEAEDWRLAVEAFENGEGLLHMSNQILLFPESGNQHTAVETARSIYQTAGLDLVVDDFMQLQGLLASLPMTGGPLLAADIKAAQRSTTKTTGNAANMLPLIADWKGSPPLAGKQLPTPVINLVSRRGQILSVNPFANPNGNYNGAIIGASGSGKSVLLNEIATGVLRTGGRVWIIDHGRSFQKLCSVLQGQYIEFSDLPRADGSFDCLNPFSLIEDIDKDLSFFLPVIAQMVSPSMPLDDLRLSHLAVHFKSTWVKAVKEGRIPTVTDLAESLIHNGRIGGTKPQIDDEHWAAHYQSLTRAEQEHLNDPRISDLGIQLSPFCKGGAYETFFNGEANIRFDNKFVVLELEQLKNKKSLQSVILMLLMCLIDQEMKQGSRKEAKLVIIDEAWDLMGEGHSGKFIEEGYRRARKYNGSFFTATQSPSDYWKSETARSALENSDCLFILRQKQEALEQLKRKGHIAMDDHQIQMLESLTTVAGAYSEVFIRIGDQPPSVNRLLLDPYSQLMTSTHPNDIEAINHYLQQGLSMHQAIEFVLKDRSK
ncbi:type IV secretion system protein TraC [Turicimonas muris]|uniref:Type-IV secretion system protein TraC n=14 Tax=Turicimonas muris TaxID=1796652 RepID=A0A227KTB5_9BURK|nr:type IV secretion system protein TraC [Turicimonas muris]ANU65292.1 type-IV secretion system protein TraC [Burkholderiales bacterium YL45]OXE51097.1 type-IV secretion system protein TraC [Turicimonas muris]QQQ96448.1 type IV secretion system protein TraC [Turicimonas muris]